MNQHDLKLLRRLLSQPTAPFREHQVIAAACDILEKGKVPHFLDPHGNLVAGVGSRVAYRKLLEHHTAEPVRVFIAHTDHPGFHGQRWLSDTRMLVKWHGGSPVKHLRGSRVWVGNGTGAITDGEIVRATLLASGHAIDGAEIRLRRPFSEKLDAQDLFGGFAFRAPVWQSGKRIYTHVADDLVGVFAVLLTALRLFRNRPRRTPPFIGLLTRGEEVGFVGAVAHLELGWLQQGRRPRIAVSLETSRTLPAAVIGRGPVVRLGDRRTVFEPGGLRVLSEVAERVLPRQHQRRVMDGGACEATAAIAWGLPAIGISVPLGNYHNQGLEGGPDCRAPQGPAPEFVHLNDVDGLVKLCRGLMEPGLPWNAPWRIQQLRLRNNLRHYRKFLAPRRHNR